MRVNWKVETLGLESVHFPGVGHCDFLQILGIDRNSMSSSASSTAPPNAHKHRAESLRIDGYTGGRVGGL